MASSSVLKHQAPLSGANYEWLACIGMCDYSAACAGQNVTLMCDSFKDPISFIKMIKPKCQLLINTGFPGHLNHTLHLLYNSESRQIWGCIWHSVMKTNGKYVKIDICESKACIVNNYAIPLGLIAWRHQPMGVPKVMCDNRNNSVVILHQKQLLSAICLSNMLSMSII